MRVVNSGFRRVVFPLRLARSRLGAGGERLVLVAVGIVAGSAALAAVLSGRLVMQDRALAQATAKLPAGERSLQVGWFGAFGGTWRALDRETSATLVRLTGEEPVRAMLFREAQVDNHLINLRGANDLARFVTLRSGRLPRTCEPSRCEVLRLAGAGPIPSKPTIRLVQVGTATLKPDAPFASFIEPQYTGIATSAVSYHRPTPAPVVLAEGVDGLSRTPELSTFFRSYGWFVPLRPGDVHPWSVGAYTHTVEEVRATLAAKSSSFETTAPTDDLTAAVAASRVAATRLLLLGGEAAALLLAFTVLAAAALRREAAAARRRLLWAGARRWQVELNTFAETGAVAIAATIAGWIVGAGVAWFVADRAGSPPGAVIEHSLLSAGGLAVLVATAIASALLLYLTVRAPGMQLGRVAITPLDVAAIAAAIAVVAGWLRGSLDTTSLGGGTSAFVLLVPGLVTFAAAVLAARLLLPALRALGRAGRRGPVALRLAALSLARNPGGATVAATFLVASLGLALFAVTYRSTLSRGEHDEAAYAAPAPYVLDENLGQLVPVLHAWNGGPATQVLRLSGNVPSAVAFTFLGVPSTALAATGGWRSDFASAPLASLAERLTPPRSMATRTSSLPRGRTLSLPVSVHGDNVIVRAFFRSPLGDYTSVALGQTDGRRTVVLRAPIPAGYRQLASFQLELINSGRYASNGGTGIQPSAQGTLHLGTPAVDGKPVPGALAGWIGANGASRRAGGAFAYSLTSGLFPRIRPRQPTDGQALPVLVTPNVAAAAGTGRILPLAIEGQVVTARIVGVIRRFPSIVGGAVVADRQTAETTLDSGSPGLGTTDELWADTLPSPPPAVLEISSRAQILAGLEADPLARGALATLGATALLALALALLGLVLGVVADRRDERGELFDLEAQGASPATIRTHLRLRALLVAVFGLVGGLATGAVLSALTLSLVSVTASAAEPEPPLRLVVDWQVLGLAVLVYAVIAAALVLVATQLPGRALVRTAETAA